MRGHMKVTGHLTLGVSTHLGSTDEFAALNLASPSAGLQICWVARLHIRMDFGKSMMEHVI